MVKRYAPACLVLAFGCHPGGPPSDEDGKRATAGTAPPAVAAAQPALTEPAQPVHPDAKSWAFPDGEGITGTGPCVGVTLSSVLDSIRRDYADVAHIRDFRSLGPRSAPMSAGPGMPVAEPPPVATEKAAHVLGLIDERSFGAVFFSGERCRGDRCEDRQYWYFETGDECRPRWVGHHRATDKAGGRHGTCIEVAGAPLWRIPGHPSARERCDADWSPQDISGTRKAFSLDPGGTCSVLNETVIPVELTIAQGSDRARATVTFSGTGIPFVDGRAFPGKVERQAFTATINETTNGACSAGREIKINLDFEDGPSINAIPGGFGLVDIKEAIVGSCPQGGGGCSGSLHLIRGG